MSLMEDWKNDTPLEIRKLDGELALGLKCEADARLLDIKED